MATLVLSEAQHLKEYPDILRNLCDADTVSTNQMESRY